MVASWSAANPEPLTEMTSPPASLLQVAPLHTPLVDVVTFIVTAGVAAAAIMDVPSRIPPVTTVTNPSNPSLVVNLTRRVSTFPPQNRALRSCPRSWGRG
jgi:hypothetical protein